MPQTKERRLWTGWKEAPRFVRDCNVYSFLRLCGREEMLAPKADSNIRGRGEKGEEGKKEGRRREGRKKERRKEEG